MNHARESSAPSTTLFCIPSSLIQRICQNLIDDNHSTYNFSAASKDVRNFAATCSHFNNIVVSSNLKLPYVFDGITEISENHWKFLEIVAGRFQWKIDKLPIVFRFNFSNTIFIIFHFMKYFDKLLNLELKILQVCLDSKESR